MTSTTPPAAAANGHAAYVRLLAVGDNVVDQYPQQGVMYPGGNAVNVAVHARRVGARAAYLGAVGTDRAGAVVLDALRAERVDAALTRVVEGPNAAAVVEVVDGNRVFADGDVGVSRFELTADDLRAAGTYDVVHTGECSYVEPQLADLARASRRLSFDFSERPWDYVQEYARHASVAIWSAPDGDLRHAQWLAERLRGLGPETAVVTLGAGGAMVLQEALTHRPAPAGEIVDTLGAGDAFIARFLVGLARQEEMDGLLGAATSYATRNCAHYGAFGYATSLSTTTSF
jgi:sugar/nucleoside kinase (ribokinase family)